MAAPTLRGRTVLIAEDDYFVATEMCRAFERAGADVVGPVGRVPDAMALVAATPRIDAAVLDVNLHDVMVFPVADALLARGVSIVFATGYENDALSRRYPGVACHEKPVEPTVILTMLCQGHPGARPACVIRDCRELPAASAKDAAPLRPLSALISPRSSAERSARE